MTSHHARAAHPPARQELAAFEALFVQYYTRVYAVLFRLVGDRAEAEDLTLETFWKLWRQPPPRADNLAGWLYRVATRLGYNAMRAAQRRQRHERAAAESLEPADGGDPAEEAERAIERARVRAILGRMPERNAQLLMLRHAGLAYKEIAAALGVSPSSVGTLLTRAEAEFEKLYAEGDDHAHRR